MKDNEIIKIFAGNLRAERARKQYTQEYLAEQAGITTEYLNKIEREKNNPSLIVIARLAKALDIDLNTFLPLK